jgi:hypothetical protein
MGWGGVAVTDDERIAYLAGLLDAGNATPGDREGLDDLRELLADPAVWADPGDDLEDAVVAAVRDAAGGSPSTASVPQADRAANRRRRDRRIIGAVAAAAAAVIAAVAITAAVRGGAGRPLTYQAALEGTALAPGASGRVTLVRTDAGWRVSLRATGLPRLDNGKFYQAWLKNTAGVLVPVGTFNQPTNVTLWSGVPPTEYPTFTVTIQQANGDPASSGRRVLAGTATPAR